jgi:lysophospholipase L1-like esterase
MKADIPRKSWFERNPKKTLLFILVPVIFGLALWAEKTLTQRLTPVAYRVGVKRSIKLREFKPLSTEVVFSLEKEGHNSGSQLPQGVALRIDENGFIMPSKIHAHPDRTIVFLGGSTTECCYLTEDKRFPYLVGRLLEAKTKLKVNSYNGGRSGNDTLHSLNVLLNKVIPLKPDIVVMMHNINDLGILMYEKTYWTKNIYRGPINAEPPSFKTVLTDLKETGHLIRDLLFPNLYRQIKYHLPFGLGVPARKDEFKKVRGKKIKIDTASLVSEFSMNLTTFINICRSRKITPVLMTMPSRLKDNPDPYVKRHMKKLEDLQGITYQQYKGAFDRFNETIREVGAREQIPVIDMAVRVPQEEAFILDLVHYSDAGAALVARIISESLQPLVQSDGRAGELPKLHRTN